MALGNLYFYQAKLDLIRSLFILEIKDNEIRRPREKVTSTQVILHLVLETSVVGTQILDHWKNLLYCLCFRFISQKGESVFEPDLGRVLQYSLGNDNIEDHAALLPPMEVFSSIDPALRITHLLQV